MENNKKDQDFETIFQNEILPELNEIEKIRIVAKKYLVFTIGCLIPIGLGAMLSESKKFAVSENTIIGVSGLFFIAAAFFGFKFYKIHEQLKAEFKNKVVSKIVQSFGENLQYNWRSKLDLPTFMESELFNEKIDEYTGEDHVIGKWGNVPFEFSEIQAVQIKLVKEYSEETVDGETKVKETIKKERYNIFKGVFFKASFNKPINGKTFIYPDFAEAKFGNFIGNLIQRNNFIQSGNLVKLENVEFEKLFAVYGTNQVESRFILTPLIMERILKIKSQIPGKMYLSFLHENVYIGIENNAELFEPKIFGTLVKMEDIQAMRNMMGFFLAIIDELNLNERLWGKTWDHEEKTSA